MALILLIDSNPIDRHLITDRLSHAGFTTITTANPQELTQILNNQFSAQSPDLIIINTYPNAPNPLKILHEFLTPAPDRPTPVKSQLLDPIPAIHQLRHHPTTQHAHILVLIHRNSKQLLQQCQKAGANSILHKPIIPSLIIRKVHQLTPPQNNSV